MRFWRQRKQEHKHIYSIVLSLAFFIGISVSCHQVLSNQYLKYDMLRLIPISFQKHLNYWVILFTAYSLILALSVLILKHLRSIIFPEFYKLRITIAGLLCSFFLFYGVYAINEYWLSYSNFHPVNLLADMIWLLLTFLPGRLLLKIKWERFFNAVLVQKFSKGIAGLCLMTLFLLNVSLFVDAKLNAPKGPNVLFLVIDTLRADHLGCYGHNRDTSPYIDDLAEHSTMFEHAISSAPWTAPSISSMFTAQYPAVLGFKDENLTVKLRHYFVTLAEVFRENNYKTKGLISHTLLSSRLGFAQGFDSYDEKNAKGHGHISSNSLLKKATAFLKANKDKKFFLFVHFFDPHYDYILHEEFNFYPGYKGPLQSSEPVKRLRRIARELEESDIEYIKALYDSEIRFTDLHIGNLIEQLKTLKLFDDTLIVLTADHGEEFLERGDYWIGHTRKLYQEQIHVPLIIKLPQETEGKTIEEYVEVMNLMPTLVNYIGLKFSAEYEHEEIIFPLITEHSGSNRPIISETQRNGVKLQSVILDDWKYIYNLNTYSQELYKLTNDPGESENLASLNQERLQKMEMTLQDWDDYAQSKIAGTTIQEGMLTKKQMERLKSLGYVQ